MKVAKLLPRFRQAYRDLAVFASREDWSRSEIEEFQRDRLNAVWRHAVAHVPFYRALRERLHLPETFGSLEEFRRWFRYSTNRACGKRPRNSSRTPATTGSGRAPGVRRAHR